MRITTCTLLITCFAVSVGCSERAHPNEDLGPYEKLSADGTYATLNVEQILTDLRDDDAAVNLRAAKSIPSNAGPEYWPGIGDLTRLLAAESGPVNACG